MEQGSLPTFKWIGIVFRKLLNLVVDHRNRFYFGLGLYESFMYFLELPLDESKVVVFSPEVFLQTLLVELLGRHLETFLIPDFQKHIVSIIKCSIWLRLDE